MGEVFIRGVESICGISKDQNNFGFRDHGSDVTSYGGLRKVGRGINGLILKQLPIQMPEEEISTSISSHKLVTSNRFHKRFC